MTVTKQSTRRKWWLTLLSAELIAVFILLVVAIVLFAFAIDLVFIAKETTFDDDVFDFVALHVTPARTNFMLFITFLGKHSFLIPANLVLIALYLIRKNRRLTIRIIALSLSSLILMLLLKNSFQRLRPDIPLLEQVSGFSFPSGHALMSVAFYGLLIYIVKHEPMQRWLRYVLSAALFILILLIAFSRVYLRVHYASDVIAGLSVGYIWLMISLFVIKRIEKKFAKKALEATKAEANLA